jgi:hypothetical protein
MTSTCSIAAAVSGAFYRVVDRPDSELFWSVSFQLTGRKSCGQGATR